MTGKFVIAGIIQQLLIITTATYPGNDIYIKLLSLADNAVKFRTLLFNNHLYPIVFVPLTLIYPCILQAMILYTMNCI